MFSKESKPKKIAIEHTIFYALGLISTSGLAAQYDFERGWGIPRVELTIDFIGLCSITNLSPEEMAEDTFDIEVDGITLKEVPDIREIRVSAGLFEDGFEITIVPEKGNEGDPDLATYEEVYWEISGKKEGALFIDFVNQNEKTRTMVPKHKHESFLKEWGLLRFFKKRITELHHQPILGESE